jgi:hypothetical protein
VAKRVLDAVKREPTGRGQQAAQHAVQESPLPDGSWGVDHNDGRRTLVPLAPELAI